MTTTGVIHSRVTLSANTTDSVTEERILALVRRWDWPSCEVSGAGESPLPAPYAAVSGGMLNGVMTWVGAGAVAMGPSRAPWACMMIWQARCMSRRRSW
jgi:hypothetical protein